MSNPSKYKVLLNGVDVSSYVYRIPSILKTANQVVKSGVIVLNKNVDSVIGIDSLIVGKVVSVQRGVSLSTERYVFRGEVVSFTPKGSVYELNVADKLYVGVRREYDYAFDANIDTEAGVGSEIVKTLLDFLGLSYTSGSVQSTGTSTELLLQKYPAKGAVLDTLKDLARIYNYQLFYNDEDDFVYFIPKGFTSTSTVLETGVNVLNRPQWLTTGEDIVNNLTIIGGSQLDWNVEYFSGDNSTTDFTLTAIPVDTDIYVDSVKLLRGFNSSSPNDFIVDTDRKVVRFTVAPASTAPNNIEVNYSYNVPVKVSINDEVSITNYSQRDATVINDKLSNSDDAELVARNNLSVSSDVLTSTPLRVISNNDLSVGQLVQVIDSVNGVNTNVVVKSVKYFYPYVFDEVEVGEVPVSEFDIYIGVLDNIAKLQRQLSSETDIDVTLKDLSVTEAVLGYFKVEGASPDTNVLYWDSDVQGDWDDFDWGDDDEEDYVVSSLIPVNRIVFEDFYSDEFKDSVNTDATWGTSGEVSFTSGQVAQSLMMVYDPDVTITSLFFEADYDGSLLFEISLNGTDWEIVTSGVTTTFTNTGSYVYFRATENNSSTATLRSVYISNF